MSKQYLTTLEHFKNRDLFYLYEIAYLWFDVIPDREGLKESPKPSVTALIRDILHNLKPLNYNGDFVFQFSPSYLLDEKEFQNTFPGSPPKHCYNYWLPCVGDWLPLEQNQQYSIQDQKTWRLVQAESWMDYLFTRDDLKELADQRKQKPPILFSDAQNDFEGYLALKEAYNSNEGQQKMKNKPKVSSQKSSKVKIKKRRLISLKGFVECVRRAQGETGLLNELYYFPCKMEIIHKALNEWESYRVREKIINKNEKVWCIKFDSFKDDFWKDNSERKAICKGIDPGHKSNDVFFETLKLYKYL